MKVYSQLEKAQLELLASDPASPVVGYIYWNTTTNEVRIYGSSGWTTIANLSGSQALSNKDLDGGTASNTSRITIPKGTYSALSALTRKAGTVVYATDQAKLFLDNGTSLVEVGSGSSSSSSSSGGMNYIGNPSAEQSTDGWQTYSDGSSNAAPLNGAGGTPGITWTRSTSNPLRGIAEFQLAKASGSSHRGNGVAYEFTIDAADVAKVLTVSFDYKLLSGTYAEGDLTVYMIADPSGNPVVVQPAGYKIQAASVGTTMKHIATFQTPAPDGVMLAPREYRLCFHVASTSTSAYTLGIDNVVVGPQTVQYGAPVTDWESYMPSVLDGSTNRDSEFSTRVGEWRRVGDSVELRIRLNRTGSASSGAGGTTTVTLPSGLSANLATPTAPSGIYWTSADINFQGVIQKSSSGLQIIQALETTARAYNSTNFPVSSAHAIYATVKIQGWSSSVQMSNDTDTRVVAARFTRASIPSISTGSTTVVSSVTSVSDTHGSLTASSGVYTVPVSGFYKLSGCVASGSTSWTAGSNRYVSLRVSGSQAVVLGTTLIWSTATTYLQAGGSTTLYYSAGDTISFSVENQSGSAFVGSASAAENWFSIERLSGPSAIAASETVAVSAFGSTSTITTTESTISFPTENYDTHGAYSAGVFTAPVSGKYLVTFSVRSDTTLSSTLVNRGYVVGYRVDSGSIIRVSNYNFVATGAAVVIMIAGSFQVSLNAGQTLSLRSVRDATGVSDMTLSGDAGSAISIVRVGN